MALEFPTSPAIGDEFTGPYGEIYTWDGDKWTLTASANATFDMAELISSNAGNAIRLGSDGKLFEPGWPGISPNAGNIIYNGSDQRPYVAPYPINLVWQVNGTLSGYSPTLGIVPSGRGIQMTVTAQGTGLPPSPGAATLNIETLAGVVIGGIMVGSPTGMDGIQSFNNFYGGAPFTGSNIGMLRFNAGAGTQTADVILATITVA